MHVLQSLQGRSLQQCKRMSWAKQVLTRAQVRSAISAHSATQVQAGQPQLWEPVLLQSATPQQL